MINSTLAERFWSKVNLKGPYPDVVDYPKLKTRCWLWTGAVDRQNYGRSKFYGEQVAHRIAWSITYGKIKNRLCALHKCDNSLCVRPSHLFLGSRETNMRDKCAKGRQAKGKTMSKVTRGESNPAAKLRDRDAIKIRRMYSTNKFSCTALGRLFSVSRPTICNVVNYHTFKHLL